MASLLRPRLWCHTAPPPFLARYVYGPYGTLIWQRKYPLWADKHAPPRIPSHGNDNGAGDRVLGQATLPGNVRFATFRVYLSKWFAEYNKNTTLAHRLSFSLFYTQLRITSSIFLSFILFSFLFFFSLQAKFQEIKQTFYANKHGLSRVATWDGCWNKLVQSP